MIVEPIVSLVERRRVGLLDDAGDVTDEDGWTLPLASAKGYAVYAWPDTAASLAERGVGDLLGWCGQPIRYRPKGVRSWPVGLISAGLHSEHSTPATLAALGAWRDWLAEHRARAFGTTGSTSWELLRATLREPLRVSGGDPPPLRGVIGGRQYAATNLPLHVDRPAVHYDVKAAYARVLAGTPYGGRWVELDPRERLYGRRAWEFHAGCGDPVFVKARVRVPELELGVLPRHPAGGWPTSEKARAARIWSGVEYPTGVRLQGIWAATELELALELGCTIEHLQGAWVHLSSQGPGRLPFEPFWWAIEQGRRMGGLAGSMAKVVGNSLWGQFAIRRGGYRETISYVDGRRVVDRVETKGGRSRAYDLAEHITGSVRAMLARQIIALGVATVAAAHTDGLWSTRELDSPAEDAGRWWRVTEKASELRVLGPQLLAAQVDGDWLYTASGVPPEMLEAGYFEERWDARTRRGQTIVWGA